MKHIKDSIILKIILLINLLNSEYNRTIINKVKVELIKLMYKINREITFLANLLAFNSIIFLCKTRIDNMSESNKKKKKTARIKKFENIKDKKMNNIKNIFCLSLKNLIYGMIQDNFLCFFLILLTSMFILLLMISLKLVENRL